MNILKKLSEKDISMKIRYYGIDDWATGIQIKQLLDNKATIYEYYQINKLETLDDYIDYIFLKITMSFFEVIPHIIAEKREEFNSFLNALKQVYEKYNIRDEIQFINNHYIEIYEYKDEAESNLYLSHDLKDYTSDFVGVHFNSFSKQVIDYIMSEATYDVLDNFEKWQKYFIKNPTELGLLFNDDNIKKTFYMRFEEIFNILESLKSNTKFSKIISTAIDVIYIIIKDNYFAPKEDLKIWQSYYMLNDVLVFFKKMKSPYAYELEKELKKQEPIFHENSVKTGHSTTIEFDLKPFVDFFEDDAKPWELRIVYLTHSRDGEKKLSSFLEQGAKSETKALCDDLSRNNPGTDDYFTSWRLRNLSLSIFEIKARIISIMRKSENISEYLSDVYGELKFICTNNDTTFELEELDQDAEMLAQYLTDLFVNLLDKEDIKLTTKNTIYGCSIFLCGLIEKILRIIFKNSMKEISYISDTNITLGTLLNENNKNSNIILDILGREQIRCLRYFLHKTDSGVGENIRNDLAHLNGKTLKRLNYDLIGELLAYLSSILNSSILYYQKQIDSK